jgi:hypothetical protein
MKMFLLLLCCVSCVAAEKHVTVTNNVTVTDHAVIKAAVTKKNARESQPEIVRKDQDTDKDEVTCCCFIKIRKRI